MSLGERLIWCRRAHPLGQYLLLWVLILSGCTRPNGDLTDLQRQEISDEVYEATRALEGADRAVDGEGVISLLSTDFYMYGDGVRSNYDSVVEAIRGSFAAIETFETRFDNIEVIVLGETSAASTFTFSDAITDTAGTMVKSRGATTLLWVQKNGKWLITYVDSDHYPEP